MIQKSWFFLIFLQNALNFDRMLTELWCEKFEWFGPSPIEPFNSDPDAAVREELEGRQVRDEVVVGAHVP